VWLGLALAVLIPALALAEGYWDSYLINVRDGFNSRTWRDNDLDDAATSVRFDTCRDEAANGTGDWGKVRLWRHAGIFPPYQVGSDKTLYCYVSDTEGWGAQSGAEDFHWQLLDFSGPNESWNVFDVGFLRTRY
jgi:hypothetical protein